MFTTLFKSKRNRLGILFILIGGLFLSFFALYNRYPLIYWDTGTYMIMGFEGEVRMERPIFYGLFIKYISLKESLGLVIFIQGLLLSSVLYLFFKHFVKIGSRVNVYFLMYIVIIVLMTGVSFYVSRLMPDVFTPIMVLSFALLLYTKNLSQFEKVYLSLLLFLSTIMHNSHLMMFLLFIIIALAVHFYYLIKKVKIFNYKRFILLGIIYIFSHFAPHFSSLYYRDKFEPYKGGHVFMLARLINTNILQQFLDLNCNDNKYSLCQYKDQINSYFMWDEKNSPLYQDGGWEHSKVKYTKLIKDVFSNPIFLFRYVLISFESSISQFFYFDIPNNEVFQKGTLPHVAIERYYNNYISLFNHAHQNQNRLDFFDKVSNWQRFLVFFSLFMTIIMFSFKKLFTAIPSEIRFLLIFIFISLIINAFLVGFFSEIRFRYQGRIVWLITLPLFLYLINNFKFIIEKIKEYLAK